MIRLRHVSIWLLIAILVAGFAEDTTSAPRATQAFRIGTAKAVVTPDHPTREWGGGHTERVSSSYHPIHVRVMTLDSGSGAVALISGEFLYWPADLVATVREVLADQYGMAPPQVLMNTTHTHNGPQFEKDDAYKQHLVDTIVRLIGESLDSSTPGNLYFARTEAEVGVNRRRLDKSGFARWGINLYGVADDEVIVVKAVDEEGRLLAVLMNYACHPTTIRENGFGGDFAGFAMEQVESATGATAVYLQGCAGEIKVHHARDDNPYAFTFDGGTEVCRRYAKMLSEPVLAALEDKRMIEITGDVKASLDVVDLPLVERRIDKKGVGTLAEPKRRRARMAQLMLGAMDDEGNYKKTRPCEVYVLAIGEQFRLVGLNGEMCVGIGKRIKAQHEGRPVLVMAYTGPSIGYFPSADELIQLGYEVKTPYSPEAEDFLIEKVMTMTLSEAR